jgi:hypothetical protein
MKKILLITLIFFCLCGVANAEGWVLWETFNGQDYDDYGKRTDDWTEGWYIVGAYPTYKACMETEESLCQRRKVLWSIVEDGKSKCSKSWGGHTMSCRGKTFLIFLE